MPAEIHSNGRTAPVLVVGPNWLKLSIYIDGESLSAKHGEVPDHKRILDLRQPVMIAAGATGFPPVEWFSSERYAQRRIDIYYWKRHRSHFRALRQPSG